MAALVETMFSVRETPWHGLGKVISEAPNSADALRIAELDWNVESHDVLDGVSGEVVDGYKANVRDKDGKILGIVSDRYKIVQNTEAFSFTDNLIGGDVRYETAGSLRDGKTVWMLAKIKDTKIAGDDVESYVCFANTHDGTGAMKVCLTPIRVVCNNTLNLALSTAKRSYSIVHKGDINGKIEEAREVLELNDIYLHNLAESAEMYANVKVDNDALNKLLNKLYPKEEDNKLVNERMEKSKNEFLVAYNMPDIKQFYGSAWGVINAAADIADHAEPLRHSKNFDENRWGKIMDGHSLVDTVVFDMNKLAKVTA